MTDTNIRSTTGSYLQEHIPVTSILADSHSSEELLQLISSTLKEIMMIGTKHDKGNTDVLQSLNPLQYLHASDKTASRKNNGITDEHKIENNSVHRSAYVDGQFQNVNDVSEDGKGSHTDTVEVKQSGKLDTNYEADLQSLTKRQYIYCGTKKITLHMLIAHFQTGTLCGNKTSPFRFGIGK